MVQEKIKITISHKNSCEKKETEFPYFKLCKQPRYDTEFFYYTEVFNEELKRKE